MKGQLEIKKFICWWCFFDEKENLCTYHTSICCRSTCKSVLREKRQDKGADVFWHISDDDSTGLHTPDRSEVKTKCAMMLNNGIYKHVQILLG